MIRSAGMVTIRRRACETDLAWNRNPDAFAETRELRLPHRNRGRRHRHGSRSRRSPDKVTVSLGQAVVVEDQPSANGIPASTAVAKAAPDGYTLIMIAANHVVNPSLYRNVPFDPVKDFKPIVRVAFAP